MRFVAAGLCTALVLVLLAGSPQAGEKEKPRYTIKQVMKLAHDKDGVLEKVLSGKATDEQKKQLTELYVALAQNAPPRGDKEDWGEATKRVVAAARAAAAGDPDAPKLLRAATNCRVCHVRFKQPKA
jgi:hypothetical protein